MSNQNTHINLFYLYYIWSKYSCIPLTFLVDCVFTSRITATSERSNARSFGNTRL